MYLWEKGISTSCGCFRKELIPHNLLWDSLYLNHNPGKHRHIVSKSVAVFFRKLGNKRTTITEVKKAGSYRMLLCGFGPLKA
jgi:hypothetical protein